MYPLGISIFGSMTKLLEKALEAVSRLSPESQDEIARAILRLAGNDGELREIDAADLPGVLEGLDQAKHRAFSSQPQLERVFSRFGR
jgi:hypothetical protein